MSIFHNPPFLAINIHNTKYFNSEDCSDPSSHFWKNENNSVNLSMAWVNHLMSMYYSAVGVLDPLRYFYHTEKS